MTRNDRTSDAQFTRQLEGYLDEYEGLTPLPDAVRDAIRAQLPTTKQIGPVSGLMRDLYMNRSMDTPARWGLVAAVIIGAVIIGGALFFGDGGVGNPPATPTPEPSAAASEVAEPSTIGVTDFQALPQGIALQAGDYAFTHIPGIEVVFTIGPGWEKNMPDWVVWTTEDDKATLGVMTVDNLYIDPCDSELGLRDPAVGPTVDDLVTALGTVPGLTLSAPTTAGSPGGYAGVRLDYVPPDGFGDCQPDSGDILLASVNDGTDVWPAPTGEDPISLYIYDVGGTRVVIAANYTTARADDLDAVLESIRFKLE